MKQLTAILAIMLLLLSCSGRRQLSPEELSHKLDSVKNVEINEHLKLQGINLEESDNPMKLFYDSLNLQTLPISYSEDYVKEMLLALAAIGTKTPILTGVSLSEGKTGAMGYDAQKGEFFHGALLQWREDILQRRQLGYV